MFLPDGTPLDTVDAMSHSWTGQWPKDRAPRITGITVTQAKGRLQCSVQAADPEGGPLKLEWDLRLDVSNNPSTGGDREESTAVLAKASGPTTELKLPAARETTACLSTPGTVAARPRRPTGPCAWRPNRATIKICVS